MKQTTKIFLFTLFLAFVSTNEIGATDYCDDIISYAVGNWGELLQLNDNYTTFPYNLYDLQECDPDIQQCMVLQIYNNFTCFEYNYNTTEFYPAECSPDIFPLCAGRFSWTNALAPCRSLDCCVAMNHIVAQNNFTEPFTAKGAYYYSLQFFSGNGGQIGCESFSSNTRDYCIQYLYYGASSDYGTCSDWEKYHFPSNADDFAFSLF